MEETTSAVTHGKKSRKRGFAIALGVVVALSAAVWALQRTGSVPLKTLAPLVVHNNLQIDLNTPDVFIDSASLSQLPRDVLQVPLLRDVLNEDFVFYYQTHADRLGLEGSLRRIIYEHDLKLQDHLLTTLLDQPAQVALWRDRRGRLSHYMVLIQRSGLTRLLEPLVFAAAKDSQLSKTEISGLQINDTQIPVYQLRYNGSRQLLFASYNDKVLLFSGSDMLFNGDQQDAMSTELARGLLTGEKSWNLSYGLQQQPAARQRIVASAAGLGFGYQRLLPAFAGMRFDLTESGWSSWLALNDQQAGADASFAFAPVWQSMPAGASFCVALPFSHGIAEQMLQQLDTDGAGAEQLAGLFDGAAGLCWYADSRLYTPLLVGRLKGDPQAREKTLAALFEHHIGARERKAPQGVLPLQETRQQGATLWQREVSSQYGQYPAAQAAVAEHLMSRAFFRVSLALSGETLLFSLDDSLVNQGLQTLSRTRPAMSDVIPAQGVVPLWIAPPGVAQLLRKEALDSLPKNSEPVFYNAAQTLLMPKLDALARQPNYAVVLPEVDPQAPWQWLPISWEAR
ncbi:DUF2138 domain-containing protein [Entomohabitans teleogrylli]|uniref:DUF2138 domain-containing protein n=1 Tax=Entomohabitans teleogrylli TaxID=1384589 RepID=UPI00073D4156|nr:DUF2138 domain-containing protein [Entomohabitans teleogrylli]